MSLEHVCILVGTGGFAIELSGVLASDGIKVGGVVGSRPDDTLSLPRWLGDDSVLTHQSAGTTCYVAVGNPVIRQRLSALVLEHGLGLGTYVHSSAWVAPSVCLSPGVIVYPNATLHAQVKLARGVLVNSNVTVGHETSVGDYSNLGPGVSLGGNCTLQARTYLGIGSSTLENLSICSDTIIGAGATVTRDICEPGRYVGTPARQISS